MNLSELKTESDILTLSIIRFVFGAIQQRFVAEQRGLSNLFSGAYAEGDPVGVTNLKNFNTLQPEIDRIFREKFSNKNGVIEISTSSFGHFVNFAMAMRFNEAVLKKGPKIEATIPTGRASIAFTNNTLFWMEKKYFKQ
jgi:hypothetical protein